MPRFTVIDTNVVVAGLITADENSLTAKLLNAMLKGEIFYLMSADLLAEYAEVIRRPSLVHLHRLTDLDIDILLTEIVANSIWREPASAHQAPDSGDNHLWRLLASQSESILVTGDKLLLNNPSSAHPTVSPRKYVDEFLTRNIF